MFEKKYRLGVKVAMESVTIFVLEDCLFFLLPGNERHSFVSKGHWRKRRGWYTSYSGVYTGWYGLPAQRGNDREIMVLRMKEVMTKRSGNTTKYKSIRAATALQLKEVLNRYNGGHQQEQCVYNHSTINNSLPFISVCWNCQHWRKRRTSLQVIFNF